MCAPTTFLFIASGAFQHSRPSDLIPELQGRLPLRVELSPLTVADFELILTGHRRLPHAPIRSAARRRKSQTALHSRRRARRRQPNRMAHKRTHRKYRRAPPLHDYGAAAGGDIFRRRKSPRQARRRRRRFRRRAHARLRPRPRSRALCFVIFALAGGILIPLPPLRPARLRANRRGAEIALAVVVVAAAMAIFGAAVWPPLKPVFSFLAFAVVARGGFLFFRNLSIRNR